MTHFLVRHSDNDIRLHDADGNEPLSRGWAEWPTVNEIANQCAAEGPGGSLLGDATLRSAFVDAVSGGIKKRDLTLDDETVPWSS